MTMTYEKYTGTRIYTSFLGEPVTKDAQELRAAITSVLPIVQAGILTKERIDLLKKIGVPSSLLEDILLGRIQNPKEDRTYPTVERLSQEDYSSIAASYRVLIRNECPTYEDVNNFHINFKHELRDGMKALFGNDAAATARFYQDFDDSKKEVGFNEQRYLQIAATLNKIWSSRYSTDDMYTAFRLADVKLVPGFAEKELVAKQFHDTVIRDLEPVTKLSFERLLLEHNQLALPVFKKMLEKGHEWRTLYR